MSKQDKGQETQKVAPVSRGLKFKTVKKVTFSLLKPKIDQPVYLRFNEPVKIGKKVDKQKDPAIVAVVTDLETGEECQFLVPSVLQGILHDEYGAPRFGKEGEGKDTIELAPPREGQKPHGYVGKCFMVIKRAKNADKAYHPVEVTEIEVE